MSIGAGIAIAGIWLAVGLCAWHVEDGYVVPIAFFAMIATFAIAIH
jgi:hypothetical protein